MEGPSVWFLIRSSVVDMCRLLLEEFLVRFCAENPLSHCAADIGRISIISTRFSTFWKTTTAVKTIQPDLATCYIMNCRNKQMSVLPCSQHCMALWWTMFSTSCCMTCLEMFVLQASSNFSTLSGIHLLTQTNKTVINDDIQKHLMIHLYYLICNDNILSL